MSIFDGLLQQVKNAVIDHTADGKQSNVDRDSLLGKIEGLFGQASSDQQGHQVRPASEDPYGDPAGTNVRPASEDPYGDPADRK